MFGNQDFNTLYSVLLIWATIFNSRFSWLRHSFKWSECKCRVEQTSRSSSRQRQSKPFNLQRRHKSFKYC